MPVYDYRCTDCNKTYDVYHKGSEISEDVFCPVCGSKQYKKLMSIPAPSAAVDVCLSGYSGGPACRSSGTCSSCEFN